MSIAFYLPLRLSPVARDGCSGSPTPRESVMNRRVLRAWGALFQNFCRKTGGAAQEHFRQPGHRKVRSEARQPQKGAERASKVVRHRQQLSRKGWTAGSIGCVLAELMAFNRSKDDAKLGRSFDLLSSSPLS